MITKIIHNRIRKRIEAGKGMVHIFDMGVLELCGVWYYLFYHIIYGSLWFWWENFKWKFNCDFSHEFDEHILEIKSEVAHDSIRLTKIIKGEK